MINGSKRRSCHWFVIAASKLNASTIVIFARFFFPLSRVIVPLPHNHTHFSGSFPSSAEYLPQAVASTRPQLYLYDAMYFYLCNDVLFLTLQGKMCNGMTESTSKAFWVHTSDTKQPFLLLLVLSVVSTGQGSGKRHKLWPHTHVSIVMSYTSQLQKHHQACHGSDQMGGCQKVLTPKGWLLIIICLLNICQFMTHH